MDWLPSVISGTAAATVGEIAAVVAAVGVGYGLRLVSPELVDRVRRRLATRARLSRLKKTEPEPAQVGPYINGREKSEEVLENIARAPLRGPRIYVSDIALLDFRCFRHTRVSLRFPGDTSGLMYPNVNLILGDNGSGKSTVLKAVALAVLAPILDLSGFVPYHLVRIGRTRSSIQARVFFDEGAAGPVELTAGVDITRVRDYEKVTATNASPLWENLFDESDPGFFIAGYGVNRRVADDEPDFRIIERGARRLRYQRVASLFDESHVLTPLSSWLPDASFGRRRQIDDILSSLLPGETNMIDARGTEPVFRHRGLDVPFRALSDGYKSIIAWVGDLLFHINSVTPDSVPVSEVGGIVLVDEVDLLLHPAWQREVIPALSRALPNLQFVFTTHSPVVAGTLQSGNILVATDADGNASDVRRIDAAIHGLNAEQILLSSYFGLPSTRAPGVQSELTELARRAMAGDDEAAVSYLRGLAGDTSEEDIDA